MNELALTTKSIKKRKLWQKPAEGEKGKGKVSREPERKVDKQRMERDDP